MLKNIRFTFQEFSDPDWGCLDTFERTYVPDEIFAPVIATVEQFAPRILSYEAVINRAERDAVMNQKWAWPEVTAFVSTLWHGLDARRAACFDNAVESAQIKIADMDAGRGGGSCGPDFIDFRRDGTLNDPVCLAHESGHLTANLMRDDPDDGGLPWNMAEMPAFFMQERAYDILQASADTPGMRSAVNLHRLCEYTNLLARIPFCLWGLDQGKGQGDSNLRDRFHAWSVDDESTIGRFERWHDADGDSLSHKAQMLHAHPLSGLLMIEFYQRFKKAAPEMQEKMLSALYDQGARRLRRLLRRSAR